MNRILRLVPSVAAAAIITIGEVWDFAPEVLRPWSLGLALLAVGALLLARRRGGAPALDWALAGYPALVAAGFWLWPGGLGALLTAVPVAALYALLLLAAALPPLVGREPFTAFYARKTAPPEVWHTAVFRRINRNMTWAWAGLFAACLLLSLTPLLLGLDSLGAQLVFQLGLPATLLICVGPPFNKWYPGHYQRKLGLERGQGPQAARDCRELLEMMPLGFNPRAAGDLKAVMEFQVDGGPEAGGFSAHLIIGEGKCEYAEGPAEEPDLVILTPGEVWLAIARGELDGRQALMDGRYQARGELSLLLRMDSLFNQGDES